MSLKIREIRRADMRDIIEIVKKSREDFLYGFFFFTENYDEETLWWRFKGTRQFPTLVAEYDGKVVGFATYNEHWSEDENLYLELLLTHPDYRGKGIGSALIKKLFDIAVEKNYSVLSLHTWGSNPAYNLYRRRGFCHIEGTFYYMINFLPQLFRHDTIKKIFDPPHKLLESITDLPKKIELNNHKAWKYNVYHNGSKGEFVFHESARKLLLFKYDDMEIVINPPEYRDYLDEEKVNVKILASHTLPVTYGKKAWVANKNESLELKLKAEKNMEFIISGLKFGFKLKVRPMIDVKVLEKTVLGNTGYIKLLIANNSERAIRNTLTILPKHRLLWLESEEVEVSPHSSRVISFMVKGKNPLTIVFGDAKKTVRFDSDYLERREDEFISNYWYLDDEEVHTRVHPKLGFYYEMNVLGYLPDLDIKGDKFYYECDDYILEVIPTQVGQELKLNINILAKRDIRDYILFRFWIRHTIDLKDQFLIPISNNKVVAIPISPSFPRWYSAIRVSNIPKWIGIRSGNTVLILSYPSEMEFTVVSSNSFVLSRYLELRVGENQTLTLTLSLRNIGDIANFFSIVEPIQLETSDSGKLILSANWFDKIQVGIANGGERNLEIHPEKPVIIDVEPFEGKKIVKTKYYGFTRKFIIFGVSSEHWINKQYLGNNMVLELSDLCGGISKYSMKSRDILEWLDKPRPHGLTIGLTRGGWIMLIKVDNRYYDLGISNWEYLKPNKYRAKINRITITREWFAIPEEGVAEKITLKNEDNYQKEISLAEYIFLKEPVSEVSYEKISIAEKTFWYESSRYLSAKTGNTRIYLATPYKQSFKYRESLFCEKPLKENSAIGVRTQLKLMPQETVALWRVLTHKRQLALQIKKADYLIAW